MSRRTDSIAGELLALKDVGGMINARAAVKWARTHRRSLLHAQLEWDDELAGEEYRVWQVRSLISVHILDAVGDRRFISLTIDRPTGGYRTIEEVVGRPDLRAIMLEDALNELRRMERKYQRLSELVGVWEEARKAEGRGRRPPT